MENETKELDSLTATEIVKKGVKKGISETVQKHWFRRLIALLLVFCVGFGIGAHFCYKHIKGNWELPEPNTSSVVVPTPTEKPVTLTISHIEEIIRPASDLITTKYTYRDADTYENYKEFFNIRLPITTNKVVFTYSGTIGIGIDISKLSSYLDNKDKSITIVLPELEIKYNEIDANSFEYYNVSTSIFNQLKMEDCTNLISTLLEEKEQQVLNNKKVIEEVRNNTELILEGLLNGSDLTKDYKIIFKIRRSK